MSLTSRYERLAHAVKTSRDTRAVLIDTGAINETAKLFGQHFRNESAVIVADPNTFRVAGRQLHDLLVRAGIDCVEPFIFGEDIYAEHGFVEQLEASLSTHHAIPIAVGSGTINDVTKLAAHRTKRAYLCVATAASMDGYTAYGASITCLGSKQTFDCPAPRVVVADLDVVTKAPVAMGASGYADLLAKVTAGADWILADGLDIEPIDANAWRFVQDPLRSWLEDPYGVGQGCPETIANLMEGLMMSGLAMQSTLSSRPASGAEHQFSHLWDMQHHTHNGVAPSHGFKVGVATAAIGTLYQNLLRRDLSESIDVEQCVVRWPSLEQFTDDIAALFQDPAIRDKAVLETTAKYITPEALRVHLNRAKERWPDLRTRLLEYLWSGEEMKQRLVAAGAPAEPEQIGISRDRLRSSHRLAYHIRRRYTVLDLCERCGLLDLLIQ